MYYQTMGFNKVIGSGEDCINGNLITWTKIQNEHGVVIELVRGWPAHMAFTVKKLDYSKYIQIAPSRHRIQFEHDPDGNIIELVQEPIDERRND
jgi:hypothetical protein